MRFTLALICAQTIVPITCAETPPAIPETPMAVDDLLYARPFELEEGYEFDWRKERPIVKSGQVVVLKVNPQLVFRRQVAEPVLYVGGQTAQRINVGYQSGHLVAIVPGAEDLTKAPAWFGTPDLPERIAADKIEAERARADAAGIKPFAASKVEAALAKGGEALKVRDQAALLRSLADIIRQYAPDESALADELEQIGQSSKSGRPKTDD